MSSNVIICPKKWFSDEGGMSANRGKAGQKEICDKKREAVCVAGKGADGTNNAEPCRAEGAEAPCLLMASFIFAKRFL